MLDFLEKLPSWIHFVSLFGYVAYVNTLLVSLFRGATHVNPLQKTFDLTISKCCPWGHIRLTLQSCSQSESVAPLRHICFTLRRYSQCGYTLSHSRKVLLIWTHLASFYGNVAYVDILVVTLIFMSVRDMLPLCFLL